MYETNYRVKILKKYYLEIKSLICFNSLSGKSENKITILSK